MRPKHWLYTIPLRLRSLFRRGQADQELDEELCDHVEQKTAEYVATGLTPQEARRQALLEMGGVEQAKEKCRDTRRVNWIQDLIQDLRYGLRMLRKSPGFTAVAVLTLALGIGANAAIFSIVNAVLLRPLPFRDSSQLVMISEGLPEPGFHQIGFSAPDLMVYERDQRAFVTIGAFQNRSFDLSGGGEPERVTGARVSASIFPMLGVQPLLGRAYTEQEDKPGVNVVLLSYGLWQGRYAAERAIVGSTITLDRVPYTVIGVMPKAFEFPLPGPPYNNQPAELWVPMALTPHELAAWGNMYNKSVVGRLRPGVTIGQARADGALVAAQLKKLYPPDLIEAFQGASASFHFSPLHRAITGPVQTMLLVLMGAVGLVLLIACANVTTLLLSRASSRHREIAVRAALGASRARLAQQMLTESLVLAAAGGALGIAIAKWGTNAMLSQVPPSVPLPRGMSLDSSVLIFVAAMCCITTIIFGVVPALQVSTAAPQESLQEEGHSGTPGRARRRLQGMFVIAEFALALVLLTGAGLLIRSFVNLLRVNPGFRPDHVLTMSVPLPFEGYPTGPQVRQFYQRLAKRVSTLPGVEFCGVSNDLPLHGKETEILHVEGRQEGTPPIEVTWALGDYFSAMGIPLLRGRLFTPEDRPGSQMVAVVSQETAKELWPGEDAIGKRFWGVWGSGAGFWTVVGVVGDVNDGPLGSRPRPHVYVPYLQLSDAALAENVVGAARAMNLVVRTSTGPSAMTSAVVAQVHSLDPELAVAHIRTMGQVVVSSVAGPRFDTLLLGLFSFVALLLAAIGIYGVLAYTTVQRTHEIGIRIALGADPHDVLRFVLWQGTKLAFVGILVGVFAALGLTRVLASLLFGVSPADPVTLLGVATVLLAVALVACYVPARRAMKVDPVVALRHE